MKNLIVLITLLTCFSSIYTSCSPNVHTRKNERISEQYPLRLELVESTFLREEKKRSNATTYSLPHKSYYTTSGFVYEIRLHIRVASYYAVFDRPFWVMCETPDKKIHRIKLNEDRFQLDNDFSNVFQFDIKTKKKGKLKISLIELDEETSRFYFVDKSSVFHNKEIQLNQE